MRPAAETHRTLPVSPDPSGAAATAQERCRDVATGRGVTPEEADGCIHGSVGCPACPWRAGWSREYEQLHRPASSRASP
jgi:hypothetical protein